MKSFPIPSRPAPSGGEDNGGNKSYVKGGDVTAASYAEGGTVLGRNRDFVKEPNPFTATANFKKTTSDPGSPQDYEGGKPQGKNKSLKPVMPCK